MIFKAVLVNNAGVVLGEKKVSRDVDRIEYGGATFVIRSLSLSDRVPLAVFQESLCCEVIGKLDKSYL